MENPVWTTDFAQNSPASLRIELAKSLGGPYLDHEQVRASYLAAALWLGRNSQQTSGIANAALPDIPGSCDGGAMVLRITVGLLQSADPALGLDRRELIFLGCRSDMSPSLHRSLVHALQRGAVLIASDQTANTRLFRDVLLTSAPAAPRRSRVAVTQETGILRSLPVLPAVRCPAGHGSLTGTGTRAEGSTVIARDALTDHPLAVVVPMLSGFVVYSTAHWLQDEPADLSGTGSRPLHAAPGYADVGTLFPYLTVGEFQAAAAMLAVLAAGLLVALQQSPAIETRVQTEYADIRGEGSDRAKAA